eukprot:Gb_00315 [translate_table: standard]
MAHSKRLKWAVQWLLLNLLSIEILMNWGVECSIHSSSLGIVMASPEQQPVLTDRSERSALFSLRSSLGLRSREWPKKVDPCATWRGIKCEGGHVTDLNISGFRRTVVAARNPRFAVDGLQNLTFLQTFNASGFALPGPIPVWFGQLRVLRVVDLSSASVTGVVPSSLGSLANLNSLALSRNNLTGIIPSTLGQLSSLAVLDLSFNNLSGPIPPTFSNLTNLTLLDLSGNNLQGPIPYGVGGLQKLQRLMLARNGINGSIPSQLGNLSLLNGLDLGFNDLSGFIPRELGSLRDLNMMVLANNFLNGSIPDEIFNCTQLQALVLGSNNLSGGLPPSLGSLTKLSILNLSSNNLTSSLPETISRLVNITTIDLSHNLFYGSLPPVFANLRQLTSFNLSDNFFEKKLPNIFPARVISSDRNCLQGVTNQRKFANCASFYSARGESFAGFGQSHPPPPLQFGGQASSQKNTHLGAILGGVFGGLGLVLFVIVLVFFVLKHERRVDQKEREINTSVRGGGHSSIGISVNLSSLGESFSYEQLLQATGEFSPSNLIKNGHSGDLYQGLLEGSIPIVVKRIDLGSFRRDAYLAELDIFGKASHTRLVPLLGHCLEREDEKLLVYKYMPNRDLSYALFKKGTSPEDTLQSLDWITRLKIAIGAAEGLSFLHHECTPPLVHRDVQASSILLDDKFEVRLGSLSEACLQEGEVHQSVIARLLRISQTSEQGLAGSPVATCAYDVYCFGKVLMELVSGKLGISGSTDQSAYSWLEWALPLINIYEKESVTKIVDPSLIVDEDLLEEVWAMAIVAKSCLNPKPSKRPLMRYILKALENPLKVVREDNANVSARLRTSSHGSWNAALFGSWRHSSSEMVAIPGPLREEYTQKGILKQSGTAGSQGSGQGGDVSSHRRLSNEIFPEPVEGAAVQASSTDLEKQED